MQYNAVVMRWITIVVRYMYTCYMYMYVMICVSCQFLDVRLACSVCVLVLCDKLACLQ